MQSIRVLFFLIFSCLLNTSVIGTSVAEEFVSAAERDVNYLWEVKKSGKASILYGRSSVSDKRINELTTQEQSYFDDASVFCVEVIPNNQAKNEMTQIMLLGKDESLSNILGNAFFGQVAYELEAHSIPPVVSERLKPWAAMALLGQPVADPQDGSSVDDLYVQSVRQNKALCSLESFSDQLGIFEQLSLYEQVLLLKEAVHFLPYVRSVHEETVDAYLKGDIDQLVKLSNHLVEEDNKELTMFMKDQLVGQRNRRMLENMKPFLEQGGVFVSISVLHLPGDLGLLALLERKGYKISQIK